MALVVGRQRGALKLQSARAGSVRRTLLARRSAVRSGGLSVTARDGWRVKHEDAASKWGSVAVLSYHLSVRCCFARAGAAPVSRPGG